MSMAGAVQLLEVCRQGWIKQRSHCSSPEVNERRLATQNYANFLHEGYMLQKSIE